jgi:hypothetical protein
MRTRLTAQKGRAFGPAFDHVELFAAFAIVGPAKIVTDCRTADGHAVLGHPDFDGLEVVVGRLAEVIGGQFDGR